MNKTAFGSGPGIEPSTRRKRTGNNRANDYLTVTILGYDSNNIGILFEMKVYRCYTVI
ncbi:MAG: hypothetical protein PUG10_05545 [Lachnospiraceae bacterium]|nr:hypothetical protein [Lachnospiraceae bacterium]